MKNPAYEIGMCRYFATCDHHADGTVAHAFFGDIPTCRRCAELVGLTLTENLT